MAEYYLVDVKSITSTAPRSQFRVDDLESLAQSILVSGGLLSPLLLKQTGPENYEVLAGDQEYYAALRAKEINPREGEMVHAFVIPAKEQEAAVKQLAILGHTGDKPGGTETLPSQPSNPNSSGVDLRVTNLESRLDEAIRDLKQSQEREIRRLEQELKEIKSQVPQRIEPLDAFNELGIPELLQRLATAKISGKTADKVITSIEQERKKAKFTSFSDVVKRVKGLSDKRMLSIIDTWGGMY